MQEPTLLALTAPAEAPRHGYALLQDVAALSGGRVKLRTGTLYGALNRLLRQGLLRVESEEVVGGRARRTYALSDHGRELLAAETERLRTVATRTGRLRPAATRAERRLPAARAPKLAPGSPHERARAEAGAAAPPGRLPA
ncbi:PadR family transcriptional regulator [Kitasatospora sp. NPDC092948]|uniref:PadR family transcriptional regulator n=1 Tax=Kitasatospora sp. NPDC092948 TaxID=3364088 RepID=UPI0037F9A664